MTSIRVTFDTNGLDPACRPERFPKDPRRPDFDKINAALKAGRIQGYFCATVAVLEGIQRQDRGAVFGSTTIRTRRSDSVDANGHPVVKLDLVVDQPDRQPLHPQFAARLAAALQIGMRVLSAPRIGIPRIEDPDGSIHLVESDEASMGRRLDKFMEAARAIEARDLGVAQCEAIGKRFAKRAGVSETWFKALARAQDIHEERAVERAIAEWADGDSVAAHIGFELDYFCTEDLGYGAGGPAILDYSNRAWLKATYGVQFLTLTELGALV